MLFYPTEVGQGLTPPALERVVHAEEAAGFCTLVIVRGQFQERRLVNLAAQAKFDEEDALASRLDDLYEYLVGEAQDCGLDVH